MLYKLKYQRAIIIQQTLNNNFRSFLRLRATFDEIVPFGELIIKNDTFAFV